MKTHDPQQARLPMASGTCRLSCHAGSIAVPLLEMRERFSKRRKKYSKNEIKTGAFRILLNYLVLASSFMNLFEELQGRI